MWKAALAVAISTCVLGTVVQADAPAPSPTATQPAQVTGPVTNLPLPRYVSLKADKGNVRRGPGLTHRIDWVFTRRDMPLEIVGEYGHWRRVRDQDGAGGWIHYTLLSGVRTAIVETDQLSLLSKPHPRATEKARAQAGVVARLEKCGPDWCRIKAGGTRGWVPKQTLWGVRPDESFE